MFMNYTIEKIPINEKDIVFVYSKNAKSAKINKWAGIKVKDFKKIWVASTLY